jgi:hypothetical protein
VPTPGPLATGPPGRLSRMHDVPPAGASIATWHGPRRRARGDHGGGGADARSVRDGPARTAVSDARRASGGSFHRNVAGAPAARAWTGDHGGGGADARSVRDGPARTAVSDARRASGGGFHRNVAWAPGLRRLCAVTRLRPSLALIAPVRPCGAPGGRFAHGTVADEAPGSARGRRGPGVGVKSSATTIPGHAHIVGRATPGRSPLSPSSGVDGLPQSVPHPADDPLPTMRQPAHDVRHVDRNVRDPGFSSAIDPWPARGDREGFREGKAHLSLPDAMGVGVPSSTWPTGATAWRTTSRVTDVSRDTGVQPGHRPAGTPESSRDTGVQPGHRSPAGTPESSRDTGLRRRASGAGDARAPRSAGASRTSRPSHR